MKNEKINNPMRFIQSNQNLSLQMRQFNRKAKLWMVFGVLCLLMVVYMSIRRPTYLIPYGGIHHKVKFVVNRVDPYYLMVMAREDAATYFNATPRTIKGQSDLFLTRILPSLFGSTQVKMLEREKKYATNNTATTFYPENNAQIEGDTVVLNGSLITWIGDKITAQKTIKLTVKYAIKNGMAYIAGWTYA